MAKSAAERQKKCRAKKKATLAKFTDYDYILFCAKGFVFYKRPLPEFENPAEGDIERALAEAEAEWNPAKSTEAVETGQEKRDSEILKVLTMCRYSLNNISDEDAEKALYHVEKLMEEMNQRKEPK